MQNIQVWLPIMTCIERILHSFLSKKINILHFFQEENPVSFNIYKRYNILFIMKEISEWDIRLGNHYHWSETECTRYTAGVYQYIQSYIFCFLPAFNKKKYLIHNHCHWEWNNLYKLDWMICGIIAFFLRLGELYNSYVSCQFTMYYFFDQISRYLPCAVDHDNIVHYGIWRVTNTINIEIALLIIRII